VPRYTTPEPGILALNSLNWPGARGSFDTVAQEETADKIATLIRTLIKPAFISLHLLCDLIFS
jgi:hypothetical protein